MKSFSPYLKAVAVDNSMPIDDEAVKLWMADIHNPLRWVVRPILQFFFSILLHIVWFFKRLPLPQFSAHVTLQKLICWFSKHFVSPEANQLMLRHFAQESNILNFLIDNSPKTERGESVKPVSLYPLKIDDMMRDTFIEHDQELFRVMAELGPWKTPKQKGKNAHLIWDNWSPIKIDPEVKQRGRFQVLDFESSHALFMCLFCLLLTAEEYRDAINGFNLDQSMALRIGQLIDEPNLAETAYNKYPLYLVGPWNLTQRFLMHGFFTEYVYAALENKRLEHIDSIVDEFEHQKPTSFLSSGRPFDKRSGKQLGKQLGKQRVPRSKLAFQPKNIKTPEKPEVFHSSSRRIKSKA